LPQPATIHAALRHPGPLDGDSARAFAALLLRTGLRFDFSGSEPRLQFVFAGAEPLAGVPAVCFGPRDVEAAKPGLRKRLAEALAEVFEADDAEDSLAWNPISLVRAVLGGAEEAAAPRDKHGRPEPGGSVHRQSAEPLLDCWAHRLGVHIAGLLGEEPPAPTWHFCASFDIDSPGMFRGRNLFRSARALAATRSPATLARGVEEMLKAKSRIAVDPHIRLRELGEALEGMDVPATFFCQTHRLAKLDSYTLDREPALAAQLRAIMENEYHEVGLHSSYATRDLGADFFRAQWTRLREALGESPAPVHRAHYLRTPDALDWHAPWRGDWVDSSLAYGPACCWRRGTAYPFRVNDRLVEAPPAVMDTQLRYHESRTVEAAFDHLCNLLDAVARTGGIFAPIWHPNEMDVLLASDWRELFFDLVEEARRRGAVFSPLARTALELQHQADAIEKTLRSANA
jgi:hypothetical protein